MKDGNVKAVIFDLYGTLIFIKNKRNPYRKLVGVNQWAQMRKLVLTDNFSGINEACGALGINISPELVVDIERDIWIEVESVDVYPDSIEILGWLKNRGYKLGVISNLATPYKYPFFRLGLDKFLDEYIFSCDVGLVKPSEGIYRMMAERFGFDSSEILMVGDSIISDVIGSRRAGYDAVLLDRYGNKKTLNRIVLLSELKKLF
ncbi:HAD family hydrolase [Patescibacteria group bacterium]